MVELKRNKEGICVDYRKLAEYTARRKSVRRYLPDVFDEEVSNRLKEAFSEIQQDFGPLDLTLDIMTRRQVSGLFMVEAPQYMEFQIKEGESRIKSAMMIEFLELWCSMQGWGACWLGKVEPRHKKEGYEHLATMAFGLPAVPSYRLTIAEFLRKPASGIGKAPTGNNLLDTLRLAPSASNGQPWWLVVTSDRIDLYMTHNGITDLIPRKTKTLDIGIMMAYIYCVMSSRNLTGEFKEMTDAAELERKEYQISFVL